MPPVSASQHRVYCAWPCVIRPRSLVSVALTSPAAPGPVTDAFPRWLTSKRPTASRTAVCSLTTPPPAYSSGIDQPPNSASLAPSATCRSCSGEVRRAARSSGGVVMAANLPQRAGSATRARVLAAPATPGAHHDEGARSLDQLHTAQGCRRQDQGGRGRDRGGADAQGAARRAGW